MPAEAAVVHRSHRKHYSTAQPQAVSMRDCRREQLPAHLLAGSAAGGEPADYIFGAAVNYPPYNTRAFLTTLRQHNQAARVVLLVAPDQVGPATN